jgi:hypothetical protein
MIGSATRYGDLVRFAVFIGEVPWQRGNTALQRS